MPKIHPQRGEHVAALEVGAAAEEQREREHQRQGAGLAHPLTSKRFMPRSVRMTTVAPTSTSRTTTRIENQSGAPSAMMMAADADDEQDAIGGGVEHLAELRHLAVAAGDVAVDPVGRAEHGEEGRGGDAVVEAEEEPQEQRDRGAGARR